MVTVNENEVMNMTTLELAKKTIDLVKEAGDKIDNFTTCMLLRNAIRQAVNEMEQESSNNSKTLKMQMDDKGNVFYWGSATVMKAFVNGLLDEGLVCDNGFLGFGSPIDCVAKGWFVFIPENGNEEPTGFATFPREMGLKMGITME